MLLSEVQERDYINELATTITVKVQDEIDNYNSALIESETWSKREKELQYENDELILLNQFLSDAKSLAKDFNAFKQISGTIELKIDEVVKKLLNEEFGIIKYNYWDVKSIVRQKLALTNVGDYDSMVESSIEWLKNKLEIYI